MKKEVTLEIVGIQHTDGEEERTELFTVGQLAHRNGHWLLSYAESEATGLPGSRTLLRLESEGCVTMVRTGSTQTRLVIEAGSHHQCLYGTPYGQLSLGIRGHSVAHTLGDEGGSIRLHYAIDMDGDPVSENHLQINIKERVE